MQHLSHPTMLRRSLLGLTLLAGGAAAAAAPTPQGESGSAERPTAKSDQSVTVAEFQARLSALPRIQLPLGAPIGSGHDRASRLNEARLELAKWAVENGLHHRGLEQFDLLLGEQPGMPTVLAELSRLHDEGVLRMALPHSGPEDDGDLSPQEFERAALHIGLLPAAGRELGALRLREEARIAFDDDGLGERALELLTGTNIAKRTAGCDLLRLGAPEQRGRAARALLIHALADHAAEVRTASAVCLGADDDPALLAPLVRALSSESDAVQAQAAEALATARAVDAVPALASALLTSTATATGVGARGSGRGYVFFGRQSAYVQDFDVEVATSSAIADPVIGVLTSGVVLDANVLSVTVERIQYRRRIARAVARLTGEQVGSTPEAWATWWETSAHRPKPESGPVPTSD